MFGLNIECEYRDDVQLTAEDGSDIINNKEGGADNE